MRLFLIALVMVSLLGLPSLCYARSSHAKAVGQDAGPKSSDLFGSLVGSHGSKNLINIVIVLTILTFAPAILLLMSSFTEDCHCPILFAAGDGRAAAPSEPDHRGSFIVSHVFHHGADLREDSDRRPGSFYE